MHGFREKPQSLPISDHIVSVPRLMWLSYQLAKQIILCDLCFIFLFSFFSKDGNIRETDFDAL